MKTLNKVCQILALLAALAAAVMFFTDFANIVSNSATFSATGAQLSFGVDVNGVDMHKSSKLLFVFFTTLITVVFAGFSFAKKGAKWGTVVAGAVSAIFMLVIASSDARKFMDMDGVQGFVSVEHTSFVWITVGLLFVALICGVVHLLVNDRIECAGKKPTIPQKVVRFIKDYKSETKKIVWPSLKDVVKNTVIVLIMCAILGAFIWLLDFGLSQLVNLLWK